MPTINQLPTVTQVSGGDQLPLYVTNQGDARRCSVTTLLEYFSQNFASPDYETIINAPTNSGFNIDLGQQSNNVFLILNPTGTFAAGSVTLPPVASCFDGQQIVVASSAAIGAFSINANGATVIGAPSGLNIGGGWTLRFSATQDTWYCIASDPSASEISFIQAGTGAVTRTAQDKMRDIVSVQDFGAVGDGVADDSVAIQNAVTAKRNVILASGTIYSAKDISLSNSQSIVGNGTIFTAAASATNIFSMANASPAISDIRINDNANSSAAAIAVKTSRSATITNVAMVNVGNAISFENNGVTGCNLARLSNVDAEQITGVGVDIGSSVSEMRWVNGHLNGKVNFVGGLGKPQVGSIGWRQHTPNVGLARGGHQLTSINCIGLDTGYSLHDAVLTVFTSCIVDATSSYGVQMTGACDKVKFTDLFCAFNAGIYVGGTSANIQFNGLETYNIGSIPIWGQAGWYEIAGPYYDLTVADTASVVVRNWTGSKRISVAAGAKLIVDDGENYEGKSVGTVAAGATTYLGVQGQTATINDAQWRAPYDCYIIRLMPTVGTAPGAGQSFTYTALINGVATTLSAAISGTSFGGVDNWSGTLVPVSKGASINIELVTSAAAAASMHSCILQIAPR